MCWSWLYEFSSICIHSSLSIFLILLHLFGSSYSFLTGGIADLVKHKWFGPFDWKGLRKGTISAPFVPDLTDSNNNNKVEGDDGADEMVVSDSFRVHCVCLYFLFTLSIVAQRINVIP